MENNMYEIFEQKLYEMLILLEKYNEKHWYSWFKEDYEKLKNGDIYAINNILSAFGGASSFSEFGFCKNNGHKIDIIEEDVENVILSNLKSEIYDLAIKIKRIKKI